MTQEYERWFRDAGQFLPPCDAVNDPEKLVPFKEWGWGCWQEAVAPAKAKHSEMVDKIETVLGEEQDDESALRQIQKLVDA